MISIAIVEDEEMYAKQLQQFLHQYEKENKEMFDPPGTVLFASFLFQRLIGQLDGCSHKRTFRSCKIAETDLIYHAPLKIICFSDALILPQHKYRDLFPESVPRLIQSHLHLIRQQTSFKRHCPLEVRLILKAIYHTVAAAFPQCFKAALICQS